MVDNLVEDKSNLEENTKLEDIETKIGLWRKKSEKGAVYHCDQPACFYTANKPSDIGRHKGKKNCPAPQKGKGSCPYCGKGGVTKNSLENHLRYNKCSMRYPCTKCDEMFNARKYLAKHMIVTHF